MLPQSQKKVLDAVWGSLDLTWLYYKLIMERPCIVLDFMSNRKTAIKEIKLPSSGNVACVFSCILHVKV